MSPCATFILPGTLGLPENPNLGTVERIPNFLRISRTRCDPGGKLRVYTHCMRGEEIIQDKITQITHAGNLSLSIETVGVPAIGTRGALSKVRKASRCYTASSTQFARRMFFLSGSADTRKRCCAGACPQLTCKSGMTFAGSEGRPSLASPQVAALQAERV